MAEINRIRNRVSTFVRLMVGLVLTLFLFSSVDWRGSLKVLREVHLGYVGAAFLMYFLGLYVSSVKWRNLFLGEMTLISLWTAIKCYWVGLFVSNFLPTNSGGDVVRGAMLGVDGTLPGSLASVFWERLTGVVFLGLWCFAGGLYNPWGWSALGVGPMFSGLCCLLVFGCAGFWVFRKTMHSISVQRFIGEFGLLRRAFDFIRHFMDAIYLYKNEKRKLIIAFLLSPAFYLAPLLLHYFIFKSFNIELSWVDLLIIVPIICLSGLVPLTPNGVGVVEGAFVLLYAQVNIEGHVALSAALLMRVMGVLFSLPGGVFFYKQKNKLHEQSR